MLATSNGNGTGASALRLSWGTGASALRLSARWAFVVWMIVAGVATFAQEPEPTAEEKKELLANERFEDILKKKPRPGTALDRVYDFHIARGSLDEFCSGLTREAKENNSGQAYLLLGLIQSRRGTDGEARFALEKAEELLPQEPLASFYLGKTLQLIGDTDAAIAALKRAIERKPEKADSLQVFQELGRVYQRQRRAEDAINVWKQMEAMFPGDLQVQELIANVLEEEGASAAALERFTALAAATKDRFRKVELGVRAAALKIKLNQHPEALADFESLLAQINPGSWLHQDIRRRIDDSFQSRRDTAGLTAYYQRWIEKHPDDIDAMMRIGRLLSIAHNSSAAKEWFSRAIERSPSSVEPRMALVEALERDGNNTAAASAMQALAEIQPDNPDTIVRWGELLLGDYSQPQAKRAAAAADVWRKLLVKHSDNPVMVSRVADLMRGASLSDEAIKLYRRAIELADSEPQYREYLGEYLHRLGRKEEALAVWRGLASEGRKNRDNLVRLSEVLSSFGYGEEALTVMGEACQLQPTFAHRMRYVDKLIEATRYADANTQLQLASQQTGSEEEQDQVLTLDIKLHMANGQMAARIEQLDKEANDSANAKSAAAWKRLALFQEADGKTQPALSSINTALALAPQSASILNIAARMQEKSGLVGDAVSSLRKLIAMDRRGQSRILMQIAAMHVRLGQMDQAIKTAQEMLATADAGNEQYRYYADLCFQSGKIDQGLDALRRNMRSSPNDREAIDLLARALGNHFKTDEAIELTWRSFAKANNPAEKMQCVQTLTELYMRTNGFDDLVKRLEAYGRQENRGREVVMLTAAAHQTSGDLATAREMLEPLLTSEPRDTELLNKLIELARADGDWEAAAEFQIKLNNLSPTPEGGLQLAKFLLEKGDVEQAESIWNKFAAQKMSVDDLQTNMRQLLASGETEKLIAMIERALKSSPDDWEVLALCMQMYYRAQKETQAQELAQKILKLDIPRETLSESAKLQRSRRASNPQAGSAIPRPQISPYVPPSTTVNMDPTATDRVSSMKRAVQIVQLLNLERMNTSIAARQIGVMAPSIVCFGDAHLIALPLSKPIDRVVQDDTTLDPFVTNQPPQIQAAEARAEAEKLKDSIQNETDINKLWDMAFSMMARLTGGGDSYAAIAMIRAQVSGLVIRGDVGLTPSAQIVMQRLADLNDLDAERHLIETALSQLLNIRMFRQASRQGVSRSINETSFNEMLILAKKMQARPGSGQNEQILLFVISLADELKTVGKTSDAESLLPFIKQHARAAPKLHYCEALVKLDADTAIDVFLAASKQAPLITSTSTSFSVSSPTTTVSSFFSELLDQQQAIAGLETKSAVAELNRSNPLRLISELKKLQAEQARRMRPSQLAAYNPSNFIRYVVRPNNPSRGSTMGAIPFPAASALQSSELLMAMYLVRQYPNNLYRNELEKLLLAEALQADDDPMQSAVDHLALCVWLWWDEDRESAIKELEAVRKTAVANDLVCMLASRLYFEAGRAKDSLAQLDQLKPTTAQLMQDRELAILQLAAQIGETDRAKQAAERLFAMRLPTQTQMLVANMMEKLDMKEMAASMNQRTQRTSGGSNQVGSLVQQMKQFQRDDKQAAAQEIARQILRRTRVNRNVPQRNGIPVSPANSNASNDSARKLALQALANSPETKEQIKQLEEKVKNNPKSTSLTYQLAELYEATGRGSDSETLLAKLSGGGPNQPNIQTRGVNGPSNATGPSAIASQLTQYRQTRSVDSVKGYMDIFEKYPNLIQSEFQYFQTAVQQHKGWDLVANRLVKLPLDKIERFNQNNFLITMGARITPEASEALAKKLLEAEDFLIKYGPVFRTRGKTAWGDESQAILVERVCKLIVDPSLFNTKNGALSGDGNLQTLLGTVDQFIATPDAAKKVLETITAEPEPAVDLKCLEVLMRITAQDLDGAKKLVEDLQAAPPEPLRLRSMWALATVLSASHHQYDLANSLLEHVAKHEQSSNPFGFRPAALLLANYELNKNFDKVKVLLDQQFADMQKYPATSADPFGNNGLQNAVRIGERYLQAGHRLEALGVVGWINSRTDVLNTTDTMYGGPNNNNPIREQINRLDNQVRSKLDAQSVNVLIKREMMPTGPALDAAENSAARNTSLPVAMLIPDVANITQNSHKPHCQFRDLLSRLNEDATIKESAQQTLEILAKENWLELKPRNLVIATYLADYLHLNEQYLSAARRLHELLEQEDAKLDRSSSEKEVQDAKALRPACWMVADVLVQLKQPELAQAFAKHATVLETNPKLSTLQLRMRLARAFKDAQQTQAAESHMRELLEQLYPAKPAAGEGK